MTGRALRHCPSPADGCGSEICSPKPASSSMAYLDSSVTMMFLQGSHASLGLHACGRATWCREPLGSGSGKNPFYRAASFYPKETSRLGFLQPLRSGPLPRGGRPTLRAPWVGQASFRGPGLANMNPLIKLWSGVMGTPFPLWTGSLSCNFRWFVSASAADG